MVRFVVEHCSMQGVVNWLDWLLLCWIGTLFA